MTEPEQTQFVQVRFDCDDSTTAWTVGNATFTEGLNRPFIFRLHLNTDGDSANPSEMLGKSCTITLERGTILRQVMGIVTGIREGSIDSNGISTEVVVVPALEAANHRVDTRIFQDIPQKGISVPDILKEVLEPALSGFQRKLENKLKREYPKCEYRVQYNESDLDFSHRLMEEEGIAYWFDFSGEKEALVLADEKSSYGKIKSIHDNEHPDVLLFSDHDPATGGQEYIYEFHQSSQLRPTIVKTRHYDWTHSTTPFEEDSSVGEKERNFGPGAATGPERQIYEHDDRALTFHKYSDGKGYEEHDGKDQAQLRRQAEAADAAVAEAKSTVLGITIGSTFQLTQHPRVELNGTYLVISASHSFIGEDDDHAYTNRFRCIPANPDTSAEQPEVFYRPKRVTPKPRIMSVQTATVVGEGGEEITTDKHARIKVQFHWDRKGENDDKSSCFVRVQQPWAGNKWGFLFIPRHGMEVVVSFVNGDPDQPVVLGSVYNTQNTPPYTLPDKKTKSTIKSSSSPGGKDTKYNEWRFEDDAGKEQVFTHAQKDYDEVVLNCHTTDVGADQTNTVHKNQQQTVKGKQDELVKGNQAMSVTGTRTVHVKGKLTETIGGGHDRTVASGVTETITGGERRSVSGNQTEKIHGPRTQTIAGNSTETHAGPAIQNIGKGAQIKSDADYCVTATGGLTIAGVETIRVQAQEAEVSFQAINHTQHEWLDARVGDDNHFVGNKCTIIGIDCGNAVTTKIRIGTLKFDAFVFKGEATGVQELKGALSKKRAQAIKIKKRLLNLVKVKATSGDI